MLLIGASVNVCLPWKSLKQTWVVLASEGGEDQQDEKTEEETRDDRNEREDKEEKENLGFDKEYFGMQSSFQSLSMEVNGWDCQAIGRLDRPVLEIQVPPPKNNC